MVPALFITVDKDNESGNKTGRKLRELSFSWETQPQRAVRLYQHTHTHSNAHIHTHCSQQRHEREREGRKRPETTGMLRSKLHFTVRPLGGRLEEQNIYFPPI